MRTWVSNWRLYIRTHDHGPLFLICQGNLSRLYLLFGKYSTCLLKDVPLVMSQQLRFHHDKAPSPCGEDVLPLLRRYIQVGGLDVED